MDVDRDGATLGDDGALLGLARISADLLHHVNGLTTFEDLAKDNVVAIEPGCRLKCDKELRAVCVGARVRHREEIGPRVMQVEVLVVESDAVDTLASSTVTSGEVTTLCHEARDDAVEQCTLVGHRLT